MLLSINGAFADLYAVWLDMICQMVNWIHINYALKQYCWHNESHDALLLFDKVVSRMPDWPNNSNIRDLLACKVPVNGMKKKACDVEYIVLL